MTTVRELLNGAHRLLNLTDSGNVLPEAVYQDNLPALNQMIDSWNTERLSVFCTEDQVFLWPVGARIQTLGPTGDFTLLLGTQAPDPIGTQNDFPIALEANNPGIGKRPILVDDSTYFLDPTTNVSYSIRLINQLQYNNIAVKTVTSTFPQVMWVNMTFPNITLHVYPVPSRELEFHFISVQTLDNPATLETNLQFPPGYLRAFRYNLALELAPEFGVEPASDVRRIAMASKRDLKRINNPRDVMAMPYSVIARRNRYNIFAGNY
jgi:hypothetical protein